MEKEVKRMGKRGTHKKTIVCIIIFLKEKKKKPEGLRC